MPTNAQTGPDAIAQLADSIITAAGADQLPEEAKQPFREQLEAQIMRRLGIIIMEQLDEAGAQEYETLVKDNPAPDSQALQAFLEKRVPDYEAKIKAGMEEFVADTAAFIQKRRAAAE
jgi:hypothetical protein